MSDEVVHSDNLKMAATNHVNLVNLSSFTLFAMIHERDMHSVPVLLRNPPLIA